MARKRRKRPHGMGCVYERSPGNWWIKWREKGRTRYAHGYQTQALAQQVLNKIVADVAAGRAGLPMDEKSVPTLAFLFDEWIARRSRTHRAAKDDACRWRCHLGPFFGPSKPGEVDAAAIRRFIEAKLAAGLNAATVGHCVRLLSTFFSDIVERGLATTNPVRTLPRATRRLCRPTTDPRQTPFVETLANVRRIFLALPEPFNVAYAVGVFAGLRTGEVLGIEWRDIDIPGRRIIARQQIRYGRIAPLKDDESRVIPIQKVLVPILTAWRLKSGGQGLLFKPARPTRGGTPGQPPQFVRHATLHKHLKRVLADSAFARLTWYQATRHTFASHWVLGGGSIEKLAMVMGHSSVVVTERYAHLRVDLFRDADYSVFDVDLAAGAVVRLSIDDGAIGYAVVTRPDIASAESSVSA